MKYVVLLAAVVITTVLTLTYFVPGADKLQLAGQKPDPNLEIVLMTIEEVRTQPEEGSQNNEPPINPQPDSKTQEEKSSEWILSSEQSEEFKTLAAKVMAESKVNNQIGLPDFLASETFRNANARPYPIGGRDTFQVVTLNFSNNKAFTFAVGESDYSLYYSDGAFRALFDLVKKKQKTVNQEASIPQQATDSLEITSLEIWRTSPPPPGGIQPEIEETPTSAQENKSRWLLSGKDSAEFKKLAAAVMEQSKVRTDAGEISLAEFMADDSKNKSGGIAPSGGSGHTDILTLNFNNGKTFEFSSYSEYMLSDPAFRALYELTLKEGL